LYGRSRINVNPDMKKTAGIKEGKHIFNEFVKNIVIKDMEQYDFKNIQFKKLGSTYRYEDFTTGFVIHADIDESVDNSNDYINYWFNVSNKGNNNIKLHRVTSGIFSYINSSDLTVNIK